MKGCIFLLAASLLLLAGCSDSKPSAPAQQNTGGDLLQGDEQDPTSEFLSLVSTRTIEPGDICQYGGSVIEAGIDDGAGNDNLAGDNILQPEEIDSSTPFCLNAPTNNSATDGLNTLIRSVDVEPGDTCEYGGLEIQSGLDDGDGDESLARDNTLQTVEIDSVSHVCKTPVEGAVSDAVHGALVNMIETKHSEGCKYGGFEIQTGIDDGDGNEALADDGVLQPTEVDTTSNICNTDYPLLSTTGLSARPVNLSCSINIDAPPESDGVKLEEVFADLPALGEFVLLTGLFMPPNDSSHWYQFTQKGTIYVFANNANANARAVALDLTDTIHQTFESGLLGMAFHPAWPTKKEVYIFYSTVDDLSAGMAVKHKLSRFSMRTDDSRIIDADSEVEIMTFEQVKPDHNGGTIHFGKDGYLYIGVGDGGVWPNTEANDLASLNGKVLRININAQDPGLAYAIPADNPFVNTAGARAEIWASGFRNPWSWTFDKQSGDLWLGDVGLLSFEEINQVNKGEYYGWPDMEGEYCTQEGFDFIDYNAPCDTTGTALPVHSYKHARGCSVTGGYVYRGTEIPNLKGQYLYGDFCQGHIWTIDTQSQEKTNQWLIRAPMNVSRFAEDNDGELYVLDWYFGKVYKLVQTNTEPMPLSLKSTGCVDFDDPLKPALGAIPYDINVPFYSDGMYKQRYLFLPEGEQIFVHPPTGNWVFPDGTLLMKTFQKNGRMIETRFLAKHKEANLLPGNHSWSAWSYEWNEAQTDATRVDVEKTVEIEGIDWTFPDRGGCLHCHTSASGVTLGLKTYQMNGGAYYHSTDTWAEQLNTLNELSLFTFDILNEIPELTKLPRLDDQSASLNKRARAFLHSNCAGCHQPGGGGYGDADYRWDTPLESTNACNQTPAATVLGKFGSHLITPGDPESSLVYRRLARSDSYSMHPYRNTVDEEGRQLIYQWIESLTGCTDPEGTSN